MRHIIAIGVIAGLSAAVPMLLPSEPEQQAAPAPAAPSGSVAKAAPANVSTAGRRVAIEADGSGHFKTEFRFNGRRIEGLVDTGATYVAINETTARRIGLSIPRSDFRHEVSTANGKTKAAVARIDAIEIGRIRVSDVDAIVLEDRALSTTLIGMNLLRQLARFEVRDGVLRLEQ